MIPCFGATRKLNLLCSVVDYNGMENISWSSLRILKSRAYGNLLRRQRYYECTRKVLLCLNAATCHILDSIHPFTSAQKAAVKIVLTPKSDWRQPQTDHQAELSNSLYVVCLGSIRPSVTRSLVGLEECSALLSFFALQKRYGIFH